MSEGTDGHAHTNRLADETSPYLLQHAHNPVDWHPWGEEALEKAREENKPILLSIGYSACHWCHVMERESFEDDEIAALMNEHFVSIKVDREERPDLDEVYMAATLAMQGHGGWPMTVFLTPDTLEPIFAGTYFPPSDRQGLPGFPRVLRTLAHAWREDPEGLRRQASQVTGHLRRQVESGAPPTAVGEDELRAALEDYADAFDPEHGGFGAAPKFPPSSGLSLLLRLHRRFGAERALEMVRATLDGMARGGIYDHVGGGFCRYAVDREWLVPHFEKMLYDNALLARTYLEGYQATGRTDYRRVAVETLDYLLREMRSDEGGFYSATDAESEGEEGKFFVWTPGQIHQVLDAGQAERFNAYYDITPGGNWEGKSIPRTPRPLEAVAEELGIGPDELRRSIEDARARVYEARERRVKPGLDDKILAGWNALAIGALAEAFRVLGEERYLEAAEGAADFVLTVMRREDGGLYRTHRAGRSHLNAVLEDYAYLAEALIDLYEAGGRPERLDRALELAERTIEDFRDPESGAFFSTAKDHEELLVRYREGSDGATPSPNAAAAFALARLSAQLGRDDLRETAAGAIRAYGEQIERYPRGFAKALSAVDFLLQPPLELALVGPRGSERLDAFRREVAKRYLPNRIQAVHDPDADGPADDRPLVRGKSLVDGEPALYICQNFACRAPITDPGEVDAALAGARGREMRESAVVARLRGRATAEGTARLAGRFR